MHRGSLTEQLSDAAVADRVDALLEVEGIENLVREYLKGPAENGFAGQLFDMLDNNPATSVTAEDLVAVSLLDVRFSPVAIDQLLEKRVLDEVLDSVDLPVGLNLWEAGESTLARLEDAFEVLCSIKGVGRTKATKLLARKRPQLAPITDSLVEGFYGSKDWNQLRPLARILGSNPDRVKRIDQLTRDLSVPSPSTLRILDITIWMAQSQATSVKKARKAHLGSPARLFERSR